MSPEVASVTNISCYLFAPLSGLKELRTELLARCKELELKGTILLSTEGINLFLAGAAESIETFLAELRCIPGLEKLTPKISLSEEQPFRRMLVRIKKEIIAFGVSGIDPSAYTSPRLSAQELKQWLDEGRPVTLLDTRNDYEVKLGTFRGAITPPLTHFRDFPKAVAALPEELKKAPIVTFCTGGIRCEKAAPYLESAGFEKVWQLEGGILKYFEECGSAHYEGECFVFDQRVGVDPALAETASAQCFVCQTPLTAEEQADSRYVEHVSCPYCYRSSEQQQREQIEKRHAALLAAATPLPGSLPYDLERPFNVPAVCDGLTLYDALHHLIPHRTREEWQPIEQAGHLLTYETREPVSLDRAVRAGERFIHLTPARREPEVNAGIRVLHEDEVILVLQKPAPLPMHEGGRFCRNTLQYLIDAVWSPLHPRSLHRLDANTTGLVLFAKTRHFAKLLQPQFEHGEVEKSYLARVTQAPAWDEQLCEAAITAEPGRHGSRAITVEGGLEARTHFRVLQRHADGSALLLANPLTGRTNQIRLHLRHLGHPIQGDTLYLAQGDVGETHTHAVSDPPLCLHAWKLSFTHPLTRERLGFEASAPAWAAL
jgi:UPF0176 protein